MYERCRSGNGSLAAFSGHTGISNGNHMERSRKSKILVGLITFLGLFISITFIVRATTLEKRAYFPLVRIPEPTPTPTPQPPPPDVEFRGLWVTRWDWAPNATTATIDQIVEDAYFAGFNAILFQVRGAADAYYPSGIEPWGRLLRGSLGASPGFDPLQRMIQIAHEKGLQVHAYYNVYTVWDKCGIEAAPPEISPRPLYYQLRDNHGQTGGKNNGLQWDTGDNVICNDGYLWASPASVFADNHYLAVARDLANRYDLDGLHLDRIRYSGKYSSCDPVSENAAGVNCFYKPGNYSSYAAFQRTQVNGTVNKFYNMIATEHPDMMLSAAVWHTYKDYWGLGHTQGYHDIYQDSQGWMLGGYIDAIMPMIYSANDANPDPAKQTFPQSEWQLLVSDFLSNSNGRFVIGGIGSNHYASFSEIAARIEIGRQLGTAGHAIFSYSGLKDKGYFDDLAAGPYSKPAVAPTVSWH